MRRLHPATIVVAILPKLREAVQALVPVLIGSFAYGHGSNHEWIAALVACFTGIFAIGAYWTTRYDIEPGHVVHLTGWIFRKDRRIPLEQIQNVNLRQNVLERLFKVATVDVETAMGKGRDLKLSVLGYAEAERFREELLQAAHLDQAGAAAVQEEPLVRLHHHDLLLGAITENHIGQMVALLVLVTGPVIGFVSRNTANLAPSFAPVIFGFTFVGLLVGSWVWGAAAYYLKYGGFTVYRNENIFKISYGLLNKSQLVIRPSRIEYLRLTTTLPQRWMDRATFQIGTASKFGEAGVFAPVALFVHRYRAYESVAGVIPGLEIEKLSWRQFKPVFYRAAVIRALVTLAVLLAVTLTLVKLSDQALLFWGIYGFIAALIVCRIVGLFLSKAENGFAITKDAFVVRRGYLTQSISAMPISRMENMTIIQPFWWTRFAAVSFSVQAMKHHISAGALPESAVEELTDLWHTKIESKQNRKQYEIRGVEEPPLALPLEEVESAVHVEA